MEPHTRNTDYRKIFIVCFFTLIIFSLDILTPRGINESSLYLIPILFTIGVSGQHFTTIMSIIAILLTFVGFYFSPAGLPIKIAIITRLYVTVGICVTWYILLKYKEKDKIITQQNAELIKNGLFNRTILESSPDCLKVLDIEGRIQFMNFNGLCQMEIDDFSIFKNKNWWSLWGIENEALVKASINRALKGENATFTAFCPTAKGTPKWWDVLVSPVGKPGEPIHQIISVSRDITEQKKEEQRLKLLESVIINTKDAVLITEAEPFDQPGPRILYVNEAFSKMTGYSADEVIGKTPRILQGPNTDKEELSRLGRAIRNWESCEITTINYKKNGEEFWINFTLTPVADEKGWYTHWISIDRDVTEQKIKELENELLAQISVNFNTENDLISATKELCKSISTFGKFDWVEVWTANLEKSEMQLFSHYVTDPEDEKFYDYSHGVDAFKIAEGLAGKVWFE
ncbi:MAG: PAS domain S-box protein, partial [Ferruginibacter sp.]|nr:PAS domain S-box protein [Ferruginibacter sp.]